MNGGNEIQSEMGNEPRGGEGQMAQGGDESAKAMEMMNGMQSALGQLAEGMKGQIPPEADKALQVANQAFSAFMQIMSKGGEEQQPEGQQDMNSAGGSNVVPADQPMPRR